jgi:hypothetical protein
VSAGSRVLALLLAAGALVGAQEQPDDEDTALEDPWTEDDPAALERLGYVRVGSMPWGDGHDTGRIEEVLGEDRYRWVETAHFRIGSALPPMRMPREKDARRLLADELEQLAERLDAARVARVKVVDPWLRTHLFAQRLEGLYGEIQALLGVTDEDFPGPDAPFFRNEVPADQKWMGRGPFLGVKGKFLVLLCKKEADCARYLRAFTTSPGDTPGRWYFQNTDAFVFATAVEFHEGVYGDDRRLHSHVVFNVTHNLLDAFKGYSYNGPIWWKEGLAHRLRREVWQEHNEFTAIDEDSQRAYGTYEWARIVKQRSGFGLVRPFEELLEPTSCEKFTLVDHMACWSRVGFLLDTRGEPAFARFVDAVQGLVDTQGMPPSAEALLAAQREALKAAFDAEAAALDAEWQAWVKKQKD